MDKEKEKKKTLTISSNFKKKIDSSALSKNKISKPYSTPKDKKISFKNHQKILEKISSPDQNFQNPAIKGKKFNRKFVEQQATKSFIKKDEKPTGKK